MLRLLCMLAGMLSHSVLAMVRCAVLLSCLAGVYDAPTERHRYRTSACSAADCANAKQLQLTSVPCLCNATAPYLHCHALAAKEAASKLQTMLGESDLVVDLGGWGAAA